MSHTDYEPENNCEMSLLEEFLRNIVENSDSNDDIVKFLGKVNAKYIALTSLCILSGKETFDIDEFCIYFNQYYEKRTRKARLENWPNDAFILRFWENNIKEESDQSSKRITENIRTTLAQLNRILPEQKKKACSELLRQIGNITTPSKVTIVVGGDSFSSFLPASEMNFLFLEVMVKKGFLNNAGITFRKFRKDKDILSMLCIAQGTVFKPTTEDIKEAYNTDANTGEPLPEDKHVEFTDFDTFMESSCK